MSAGRRWLELWASPWQSHLPHNAINANGILSYKWTLSLHHSTNLFLVNKPPEAGIRLLCIIQARSSPKHSERKSNANLLFSSRVCRRVERSVFAPSRALRSSTLCSCRPMQPSDVSLKRSFSNYKTATWWHCKYLIKEAFCDVGD